jgi:RNA dependent RNA polymerase
MRGPLSDAQRELYMGKYTFRIDKEPVFEQILYNMVLGNAVNLKKKARIKVKSAGVFMGIIDEEGILNEGEVFVRV